MPEIGAEIPVSALHAGIELSAPADDDAGKPPA
jgi:hypothetical protein